MRRPLLVILGLGTATLASAIGYHAFGVHQAESDWQTAMTRLDAPLEAAPTYDDIDIAEIVVALERSAAVLGDSAERRAMLRYARALEDVKRGDLRLAIGELRAASVDLPNDARIQLLRSEVALRDGDEGAAAEWLTRALESNGNDPRTRLLAADLSIDEGAYQAAGEHLAIALRGAPRAAILHERRAEVFEARDESESALSELDLATTLAPNRVAAWLALGGMARRFGEHVRAKAAFARAVALAPADPDAHLGLGLSLEALGELETASGHLARAAELAPRDATALLALGDMLSALEKTDEAIHTYRGAIARDGSSALAWLKLGNALVRANQLEASVPAFEAALDRDANLGAAHNGMGLALMQLGRHELATAALSRASELDETDPHPLMNLALLAERRGNRSEARRAWEAALSRDPSSHVAQARLASLR